MLTKPYCKTKVVDFASPFFSTHGEYITEAFVCVTMIEWAAGMELVPVISADRLLSHSSVLSGRALLRRTGA